jgi:SH3-like domain-containing protein
VHFTAATCVGWLLLLAVVWSLTSRFPGTLDWRKDHERQLAAMLHQGVSFDQIVRLESAEVLSHSVAEGMNLRTVEWVNFRVGPNVSATRLALFPPDTQVVATSHRVGQWLGVVWQTNAGWIHSKYLVTESADSIDTPLWITRPYFTIRPTRLFAEPATRSEALAILPPHTRATRLERSGFWIKVNTGNAQGWLRTKDILIQMGPGQGAEHWQAICTYLQYAFPENTLMQKVWGCCLGLLLSVGIGLVIPNGRGLMEDFRERRTPLLFVLQIFISSIYFWINSFTQTVLCAMRSASSSLWWQWPWRSSPGPLPT